MGKIRPIALAVVCAYAVAGCAGFRQPAAPPTVAVPQRHTLTIEAEYALGRYYQGQARYAEAIAAYQEVLARRPSHVDARNGLGVSLAEQGNYEDAIAAFKEAIAIAPDRAYLHNNLGYTYLLQGANEAAVNALEEARRLDPDPDRAAHRNLRLAYERMMGGGVELAQQESNPDQTVTMPEPPAAPVDRRDQADANAPSPTVTLVEVAPSVYQLQAPAASEPPSSPNPPVATATPAIAEAKPFKLEVSNGNGVTGMAGRVARFLARNGVRTGRLTNDTKFTQPQTYVQYREGYRSAAIALGEQLPKPLPIVQVAVLRSDIDVRLVLGHDWRNAAALFEVATPKVEIACQSNCSQ